MFFDAWHKDSFLPQPPEDAQQNDISRPFLLAIALACAAVGIILQLSEK